MTAQTVTTKNNSSIAQNNRSRILGEKLLLAGDLDHGEDGGSNFSVYLPAENGLLNELLGGAEIGWTRRCPTRCGRTCQWNEESALLYL